MRTLFTLCLLSLAGSAVAQPRAILLGTPGTSTLTAPTTATNVTTTGQYADAVSVKKAFDAIATKADVPNYTLRAVGASFTHSPAQPYAQLSVNANQTITIGSTVNGDAGLIAVTKTAGTEVVSFANAAAGWNPRGTLCATAGCTDLIYWSNVGGTLYFDAGVSAITQAQFNTLMTSYLTTRPGYVAGDGTLSLRANETFAATGTSQAQLATPTLTAGSPTSVSVGLSWTAPTNATSYTLSQSSGGSAYSAIYTGPATSYTATGLSAATAYSFRVAASASGYTTSGYGTVSVTTAAASTTAAAGSFATVTWAKLAGGATTTAGSGSLFFNGGTPNVAGGEVTKFFRSGSAVRYTIPNDDTSIQVQLMLSESADVSTNPDAYKPGTGYSLESPRGGTLKFANVSYTAMGNVQGGDTYEVKGVGGNLVLTLIRGGTATVLATLNDELTFHPVFSLRGSYFFGGTAALVGIQASNLFDN